MTLCITYPELSEFLCRQTGKELSIAYKSENRVTATYNMRVTVPLLHIPVQKSFSADLQILEFTGSKLIVGIDAGNLANTALNYFSGTLLSILPVKVNTGESERTFISDFQDIEQIRPVLEKMTIDSISAQPDSIVIEAKFK